MNRYGVPRTVVTDRLQSYGAAMKDIENIDRQDVRRHFNSGFRCKLNRNTALREWHQLLAA